MPAWVQTQLSTFVQPNGSVTSVTYTLLHTFTAGNSLVGAFYLETGAVNSYILSSITDNAGNTYTILDHIADGIADNFVVSWGLAQVKGVPTTVTATFSQAPPGGTSEFMWAEECSGVGYIDKHTQGTNPTSTSTLTSGSVTTTGRDLVLGFVSPDTGTSLGAGTNFTLRDNDTTNGIFSESLVQTTPGSVAATFAITSGTGIVNLIALAPPLVPYPAYKRIRPVTVPIQLRRN